MAYVLGGTFKIMTVGKNKLEADWQEVLGLTSVGLKYAEILKKVVRWKYSDRRRRSTKLFSI